MTTIARNAAEEIFGEALGPYADVVDIIQRAIDASREWQPIETAPKDGTLVLLAAKDPSYPRHHYMAVGQWTDNDYTLHNTVKGWFWPFAIRPTHWMPLPAPPKGNAP